MFKEGPHRLDEMTAAWQQAKQAFEESERRYRNLVEHSLGLICTHDLDGRLLSINPAAAHSLGYEPEHGVGLNLATFLAPETRHLFDDYLQRIRDHGQDAGLMRVIARNGRARVWMYRNVLCEEPGSLRTFSVTPSISPSVWSLSERSGKTNTRCAVHRPTSSDV